jgi:hypothetical protein
MYIRRAFLCVLSVFFFLSHATSCIIILRIKIYVFSHFSILSSVLLSPAFAGRSDRSLSCLRRSLVEVIARPLVSGVRLSK